MRREDTLRFLTRIPLNMLWCAELPTQYTLRLKNPARRPLCRVPRIPSRTPRGGDARRPDVGERTARDAARARSARLDHRERNRRTREQGYNTLKLLSGPVPESPLNFCDMQGLYVIAQAPIDTRRSGIRAAGAAIRPTPGMARSLPRTHGEQLPYDQAPPFGSGVRWP